MPFQDSCAFIERCFAELNPQTGRSCSCSLPASGKWETEILMEVLTPTEYAAILQLHGRCFFADEAVLAELKSGLLRMGKGAAEADE